MTRNSVNTPDSGHSALFNSEFLVSPCGRSHVTRDTLNGTDTTAKTELLLSPPHDVRTTATSMPGSGLDTLNNSNGHNHGLLPTNSKRLESPVKDSSISSKVHRTRKLNDYITIPRRPRPHPQNPQDYVPAVISDQHATKLESPHKQVTRDSAQDHSWVVNTRDTDNDTSSGSPEKRERSWSFKKIKNALGRSKSFSKSRDPEESDQTCATSKNTLLTPPPTPPLPVARGHSQVSSLESTPHRSHVSSPHRSHERVAGTHSKEDIYSELDIVKCRLSLNTSQDLSDKNSCRTNSSGNVSVSSGAMDRRNSAAGVATSESKTVVGKVLSSLSNFTSRRRQTKKNKQVVENSDYYNRDCTYGAYRSSMKETSHRKNQTTADIKRSKSFTTTNKACPRAESENRAEGEATEDHGARVHYDVARADGIYSLATSDSPPPLPERTYLKLRNQTAAIPVPVNLHSQHMGYDATGKSVIYSSSTGVRSSTCKHSTVHGQLSTSIGNSQQPLHAQNVIPSDGRHANAKPFMLHRLDLNHNTDSSGYGSVNSDTFSTDSDYTGLPDQAPLSCKLPRRSRRVSENGPPLPMRNPNMSGHYTNNSMTSRTRSTVPEKGTVTRDSDTLRRDKLDSSFNPDMPILRNKVHNLPLLPDQHQVELVQTIDLENIIKDKWISGLAVTKKNEYIVVDQREAYLLDEEGVFRKSIGSKGSTRLIEPLSVTVMPTNGNLVFCDHAEQDIKVFNWKGQFLRRFRDQGLTNIAGVAATDNRSIIVAGTDKKRLSVLSEEGKLLYTIPEDIQDLVNSGGGGERSSISPRKSPFEHPYSVTVNPLTGDIIVGDDSRQVVTAVAPRTEDGRPARVLWRYSPGSGKRHFFPSSICADQNGYIFIADLYNEMVYMLDSGGKVVKNLLSRGNGLKGGPGAIATDGRGHLLVADEEKTLKIFRYDDDKGFAVNQRYSFVPHAS